ncbi:hypothetical protein [Rhodohalobacter mucosus]|uniref:Uncharacterized protein n=1 Tax=Rhodohalobacter mucosus TaxID=2079485 RepID=A0A316TW04_9BACT|nr:hypothetical protein [Rhodohalobacter mucosus]PWN06722.1 hypothetical protein DDZ15_09410 [Rhodohalobacter mucosus]
MSDLDRKLQKKLKTEEEKAWLKEKRGKNKNKYVIAAILFLGTLVPLYLLWFLTGILFNFYSGVAGLQSIDIAWISPLIHGAIWAAAVISVFKKRSVLDTIVQRI